ncbi:hypothetical protein HFD88_009899 [Aspergillus terreus]|nr:hypothetical protein HFD88_009899 [Aspergillus terreus]
MFSYHRVLKLFGRSVTDKTLECDCDIHPWEIEIDGQQWPGKIRLIGFVDVFFVISYSANARFEKGIIVYKDRVVFEELIAERDTHPDAQLPESEVDPTFDSDEEEDAHEDHKSPVEEESPTEKNAKDKLEFTHQGRYVVRSQGHEIGLTNEYPLASVRSYEIKINKPQNWALRRRIKRGIRPHSIMQLMDDVIRCGFLTHAELIAHVLGLVSAGGTINDTAAKYFERLGAGNAGQQALSNEKV